MFWRRIRYVSLPPGVNPLEDLQHINDQNKSKGGFIWIIGLICLCIIGGFIAWRMVGNAAAKSNDTPTPTTPPEILAEIITAETATPTPTNAITPTPQPTVNYPATMTANPNLKIVTVQVTQPPLPTVVVTTIVEKSIPGPVREVVVTKEVVKEVKVKITELFIITPTPGPTQTPWIITETLTITPTPGPTQTPWIITETLTITPTPGPTQTPWIIYIYITPAPAAEPTMAPTFRPDTPTPVLELFTPTIPPRFTETPTITPTETPAPTPTETPTPAITTPISDQIPPHTPGGS